MKSRKLRSVFICVHLWLSFSLTAFAHEGEDHSAKKEPSATTQISTVSSVTAERNLPMKDGNFVLKLTRTPSDVRAGEATQFALKLAEK